MQSISKFETNSRLQLRAELAAKRYFDDTRHRSFISYHVDDSYEVETFLDAYGSEFHGTCIGITEKDDFIDSPDSDYIKRRIRELYLAKTTVTIVLLGRCTWARQFVDWEISSTLRDDPVNMRSGLLAIPLPSMNGKAVLPPRFADNYDPKHPASSYGCYFPYPSNAKEMRLMIELAFQSRSKRSLHVNNSRDLFSSNRNCL